MNISFSVQNTYSYLNQRSASASLFANQNNMAETPEKTETLSEMQRLRQMIRDMNRTKNENPYAAMPQNSMGIVSTLYGNNETKEAEEEVQKVSKYNYKEVANKILRAKTALSAGQAVFSAKRKVVEVKRKIAVGDGDPEELQIALTHAKRMELAAQKKKRHLEIEEMVVAVQKRDEKLEQMEEATSGMQNSVLDMAQEELTKQADAIFDERKKMLDELMKQQEEQMAEISEEQMAGLNEMIAEFGEDELKELQEAMELFDSMEIINPHMSKEDLEELKRKHRNEEYKAILKAEMDYLKDMTKYIQEKSVSMAMNEVAMGNTGMAAFGGAKVSAPEVTGGPMPSIDVQV